MLESTVPSQNRLCSQMSDGPGKKECDPAPVSMNGISSFQPFGRLMSVKRYKKTAATTTHERHSTKYCKTAERKSLTFGDDSVKVWEQLLL